MEIKSFIYGGDDRQNAGWPTEALKIIMIKLINDESNLTKFIAAMRKYWYEKISQYNVQKS